MTPSGLREKIIVERVAWIRKMIGGIQALPLDSMESFFSDPRNAASAESYLRRALEALMDLGRHILAKGFGKAVTEHKKIPGELHREGVLHSTDARLMRELAGYRNRMVHFYDEVTTEEIFHICHEQLSDVERILAVILKWINSNPELLDRSL
ncbi:MAG TPA: DUF86 domain-containing protein [Desulfatiglandales bacterium]|nr:DUF86 domain-containing protein [Desulfatiglandales bacterium]